MMKLRLFQHIIILRDSRKLYLNHAQIHLNTKVSKVYFSSSTTTTTINSSVLIDKYQRKHNYLRISLTEKCNLRCVYCMPEEGIKLTPKSSLLDITERKRLISLFASLGINKIRFTGGEPTISNQLLELIKHAKLCNIHSIGITSNGLILKEQLDALVQAGLTSVNISLDTLVASKYGKLTRRDDKNIYRVLASIYKAIAIGLPVKINCVLMRGYNDEEIIDFVKLTEDMNIDCRFIELMPFDGNDWNPKKFIGYHEVIDRLATEHNIKLLKYNKNDMTVLQHQHIFDPSDTTKWYKVSSVHKGRIGFITSMTSNFCGSCNRLRLTADGKLKVCLFGSDGLDLLNTIRDGCSDEEISHKLFEAVQLKKHSLGGHLTPEAIATDSKSNRPMILIGG